MTFTPYPYSTKTALIQRIVEKHTNAMARELTEALLQTMVDQLLGERLRASTAAVTPQSKPIDGNAERRVHVEPAARPNRAPLYDGAAVRWRCPYCNNFSDPGRRAVTMHMRFCEGGGATTPAPSAPTKTLTTRRKTRRAKP